MNQRMIRPTLVPAALLACLCCFAPAPAWAGTADSPNTRVDTRGRNLVSLTITPATQPAPAPVPGGPQYAPQYAPLAPTPEVPAGGTCQLRALAGYDDGSNGDVTSQVRWSLGSGAPPKSTISSSGLFSAGPGQSTSTFNILAWLSAGNRERTASFQTRVIPNGLAVAITVPQPVLAGAFWRLTATAVVYRDGVPLAPGGTATVKWDFLDDDGLFDDGLGTTFSTTLVDKRSYVIRAQATAGTETATAAAMFSVDTQALGEPVVQKLADVFSEMLLDAEGKTLSELPATTKLAVVIHGLENQGSIPWVKNLCAEINKKGATAVAYDWKEMADPSLYAYNRTSEEGDLAYVEAEDTWQDVQLIRKYGEVNGMMLAERLLREFQLGKIGQSTPIHLIGHSAGGFVAGECAFRLEKAKFTNLQVTMLDTPAPFPKHLNKPGWRSERYNSSWLGGRFEPSSGMEKLDLAADIYNLVVSNKIEKVLVSKNYTSGSYANSTPAVVSFDYDYKFGTEGTPGPQYRRADIVHQDPDLRADVVTRHGFAHEWYRMTVAGTVSGDGYYYSNLNGKPDFPAAAAPAAQGAPLFVPQGAPPAPVDLDGFTYFGVGSGSGGVHTLVEETDAGFSKAMVMPVGAQTLRFRYHFAEAGDGDFLSAHWGTDEVLAICPDTATARAGFVEMEADVAHLGGRAGTLVFKLTSRGEANAVAEIDQIQVVLDDDPDGDGLTLAQEAALGTDSALDDTDGDGLADADEANTHHTNPLLADSDGDTIPDPLELALGTNPNDRTSAIRPRLEPAAGGTVVLRWQGVAGRAYSVVRSPGLDGSVFDFIATGVPGGAAECAVADPTPPAVLGRAFYWVLQDP